MRESTPQTGSPPDHPPRTINEILAFTLIQTESLCLTSHTDGRKYTVFRLVDPRSRFPCLKWKMPNPYNAIGHGLASTPKMGRLGRLDGTSDIRVLERR